MAEAAMLDVLGLQLLLAHEVGHLGIMISVLCITFSIAETQFDEIVGC
jgi:hypothetical protein